MNIRVHVTFHISIFMFLGCVTASEIAGSLPFLIFWGTSILAAPVYMPTKTTQGSLSPHPRQCLLLVDLWIIAFLTGVIYLTVVLICISLTIRAEKAMAPSPVLLPGKSHGQRSLESDTTERLFMHWRRKGQPTPEFLPGESQGRGSLVGYRLWGRTESDTTEAT